MSKFTKTILASTFFAASMMSVNAAHAATATASASANILTSVSVTKDADLDFGTIAAGTGAATVTIAGDSSISCSGVLLCPTQASAASFTISGTDGQKVGISVPPTVDLINQADTSKKMTATLSTASSSIVLGTANSFAVGGTLSLGANQANGSYAATFDVTVAYQ